MFDCKCLECNLTEILVIFSINVTYLLYLTLLFSTDGIYECLILYVSLAHCKIKIETTLVMGPII